MPPTIKTKNDYGKVSNHPRTISPLGSPLHGEGRHADGVQLHKVQACIKTRAYTDKNGATRYENQVVIMKLI